LGFSEIRSFILGANLSATDIRQTTVSIQKNIYVYIYIYEGKKAF
jgi:hypothetical protein